MRGHRAGGQVETSLAAWGTIPRASSTAGTGGVPPFLLRRFVCLERTWEKSCELLPVRSATWACNLILGAPKVRSQSLREMPGGGWVQRGVPPQEELGPASPVALGPGRQRTKGSVQRPELSLTWGARDPWV